MRPGENAVRLAAAAFMRQFAHDAGLSWMMAEWHAESLEMGGIDVMPAIAAALASAGKIDTRPKVAWWIDENGDPAPRPSRERQEAMREVNPKASPERHPESPTAWAERNRVWKS